MNKDKRKNIKRGVLKSIGFIFEQTIAIIISVLFCLNANIVFGNLGHLNTQINLADDARMKNDYSESLMWYEKIAKRNNQYSPYAYLAIAEIYSTELENKEYDEAYDAFKNAFQNSDDMLICSSCMHFILQQIDLLNKHKSNIDILDLNHIDFVTDVMNKLNELSSTAFLITDLNFPLSDSDVLDLFSEDEVEICYRQFQYDYTSIKTEAGLEYVAENDKMVLVESWQERVNPGVPTDASVVTYYKYFSLYLGDI